MKRHAFGNCAVALLCTVGMTFGPNAVLPSNAAQVAASIEYDFVARPPGLPSDFEPSAE
jgi:hypothetical protein